MNRDAAPWRVLERAADVTVVGLMTMVVGAAIVTAPAAMAAAVRVLASRDGRTAVIRDYGRALRATLKKGVVLGSIAATTMLVGVGDLVWATSAPLTPVTTVVLSAGALLVLATCSVSATAVVRLSSSGVACQAPNLLLLIKRAAVDAAAAPHRSLALGLLTALVCGLGLCLAPLTPVVLGGTALLLPRIVPPAVQRRGSDPLRPTHSPLRGAHS